MREALQSFLIFVNVYRYCASVALTEMTPTQAIAAQVRRLRNEYGWSAQRLADELTSIDVTWDRMVVVNLELGRRASVSVMELLALAHVFEVPVFSLLAPLGQEAKVQVIPGLAVEPHDLALWFTGRDFDDDRLRPRSPEGKRLSRDAFLQLSLYGHYLDLVGEILAQDMKVRKAKRIGEAQRIQEAEAAYVDALERWASALTEMREKGLRPPEAHPSEARFVEDARSLGLLEDEG